MQAAVERATVGVLVGAAGQSMEQQQQRQQRVASQAGAGQNYLVGQRPTWAATKDPGQLQGPVNLAKQAHETFEAPALAGGVDVAPAACKAFQKPWCRQCSVAYGRSPVQEPHLQHLAPQEVFAGARYFRPEVAELVCWRWACIPVPELTSELSYAGRNASLSLRQSKQHTCCSVQLTPVSVVPLQPGYWPRAVVERACHPLFLARSLKLAVSWPLCPMRNNGCHLPDRNRERPGRSTGRHMATAEGLYYNKHQGTRHGSGGQKGDTVVSAACKKQGQRVGDEHSRSDELLSIRAAVSFWHTA